MTFSQSRKTKPIQSQSNPIKPNSNPIKPNSNPIKPNLRKARMDVSLAITRNYNNEQRTTNNELLFKTNPIQSQFKPNLETTPGPPDRNRLRLVLPFVVASDFSSTTNATGCASAGQSVYAAIAGLSANRYFYLPQSSPDCSLLCIVSFSDPPYPQYSSRLRCRRYYLDKCRRSRLSGCSHVWPRPSSGEY